MIGAVDIGGTKIAVAAVRENGTIHNRRTIPTSPEDGPDVAARRIVSLLRDCQSESGYEFTGIGVGCTGPVGGSRTGSRIST